MTPEQLVPGGEASLTLRLEQGGRVVTDRTVTMTVYREEGGEPMLQEKVDVLEGEYLAEWTFDRPGGYRVVLDVVDPANPGEALRYEVHANVTPQKEEGHGFMGHHLGSWGWWGGGLMIVMMVTMMILL